MRKKISIIMLAGLVVGLSGLPVRGAETVAPVIPPAFLDKARGQAEIDGAAVQKTTEKARSMAETMTIPENKHKEAGQKAAEETNAVYRSKAFQDKVNEYENWEDLIPGAKSKETKKKQEVKGILADSEKIYLFLSSSIPVASFNGYMANMDGVPEIEAIMYGVVGGFKKEKKKERVAWWRGVLKKDTACREPETPGKSPCDLIKPSIIIKPGLFRQYEVTEVPALVYVRGDEVFQIQGDVGIITLLEKVNQEAESPGLATVVTKIRGSR
jgi:hypothetical protein